MRTIVTAVAGNDSSRADLRSALDKMLRPVADASGIRWLHHDVTTLEEARSVAPHAILAAPSTSSWARARHIRSRGPQPLRDAQWPWGLPSLIGADRDKVESENDELRISLVLIDCSVKKSANTTWFLIFPEDRGRGAAGHPASIWQLRELRAWSRSQSAVRGALNQCEVAPEDSPRPLGFLKHSLENGSLAANPLVAKGWPVLSPPPGRHYLGPLPRKCRCGLEHTKWTNMHDADAKKFSAETISQAVASWFAHQVLRPHIGLSAGSSTLLRKGVGSGLAQASAGKAALGDLPMDDPEPSDSGTEDTWPEAEESANLNDHYVDAQLISLLSIQDSFIAPHVQVPIISPHVRAPSIQDFSNEAPAPPRPLPATGWGRTGRDIESCRRPRVRAGNPACGSEAGLDRIAVYLGRPG